MCVGHVDYICVPLGEDPISKVADHWGFYVRVMSWTLPYTLNTPARYTYLRFAPCCGVYPILGTNRSDMRIWAIVLSVTLKIDGHYSFTAPSPSTTTATQKNRDYQYELRKEGSLPCREADWRSSSVKQIPFRKAFNRGSRVNAVVPAVSHNP